MTVEISLDRRHAVVTGGSTGLGLAIVQRLLRSGANVTVWGREPVPDEIATGFGPSLLDQRVDVTDAAQIERALRASEARFGSPSILVNNAGIAGPHAPLWETPADEWCRVLAVNLTAVFHCCKAVVPGMRTNAYGRIVNISSVSAKDGNPMICAYAAAKAGVVSLTKSLGKELATSGVLVNCVTPGAIRTAIFDRWPEDYVQSLLAKIPMGRFGKPEELAALVAWLCSDEASFSTGAVFDLSGGRAVY